MKIKFLITLFTAISYFSFSQGTVRGKITDKNGETLIGATVVLKSNPSVGSVTDFDGNYSIKIADATPQTLVITFISYKTLEEVVNPHNGEVIIKNILLQSSANEVKAVEITARALKARDSYMEKIKLNSAATIDYVSNETMKKTGDANVTSAVARVSGVSTNGQFITVRGIGDRYVKTAINGSRIPTLDPFTNNIKLDLFPASLVDNVIITKTASPDLPGDWAGAYLSIETKDYPEELAVNVETQFGYNNQSTNKDVVSSQRSSTDWLGYDKKFRDINHDNFVEANMKPSQYEELVALGLGDYFNSLGVTKQNFGEGQTSGETYFRLALVQLGLLAPALINDDPSVTSAKTQYYSGSYQMNAFNMINSKVSESGKSFANNWNTTVRKAPFNFSQSFSIGNQTKLFGKQLGYVVGLKYGSATQYDPTAEENRQRDDGSLESKVIEKSSIETNGWSALLNLAYKLNSNHSVSLLFMPNLTGINKVKDALDNSDSTRFVLTKTQNYEQRKQLVYQFKSEHYLPGPKLKIGLKASYTNGKSSVPDFKRLQYWKDEKSNFYQIGGDIGNGIHRYYRYLSDNLFDSHLCAEFLLGNKPGMARKIKFGGAYQRNDKKNDQYDYSVHEGLNDVQFNNNDLDQYFDESNFGISSGVDNNGVPYSTFNLHYDSDLNPANHTFGNSEIIAGFLMCDYALLSSLRFSGGLRVEQSHIMTDVFKFDSLNYAVNDPRRFYKSGYPLINPGKQDELNYLPSANIIYKLRANDESPMNLRLNYSKTIARPSIRELSGIALLDYEYNEFVYGNPNLKTVHIDNYDLRWETYFKSNDNISISLFYKDFTNHIEIQKSVGLTWKNVPKSQVAGIELEGRKIINSHFDVSGNVAFIYSHTKYTRTRDEFTDGGPTIEIPIDTVEHPMLGQAPYVANIILSYKADSIGLGIALTYNIQGPRLVIASAVKGLEDIYEQPRNLFDLKLTKNLGKHVIASFTVRDLLNTSVTRRYQGTRNVYDNFTYGTTYLLALAYRL